MFGFPILRDESVPYGDILLVKEETVRADWANRPKCEVCGVAPAEPDTGVCRGTVCAWTKILRQKDTIDGLRKQVEVLQVSVLNEALRVKS